MKRDTVPLQPNASLKRGPLSLNHMRCPNKREGGVKHAPLGKVVMYQIIIMTTFTN